MNREEATRAIETLAASPASAWIGNRVVGGAWLQKCMRCGAEETIALPPNLRSVADVPVGFDEALFRWKRSFQVAHESCAEASSVNDPAGAPNGSAPRDPPPGPPGPPETPAGDVTLERVLRCEKHGVRRWRGHVLCYACGRTYQTADHKKPGYAPDVCRCGRRLLPPDAERVGDVLGLQTGGVVVDEDGRHYQTPEAADWTARSICYLCHRYFAKHHGGRVPVERGRN
jgi:hypothetical protein